MITTGREINKSNKLKELSYYKRIYNIPKKIKDSVLHRETLKQEKNYIYISSNTTFYLLFFIANFYVN